MLSAAMEEEEDRKKTGKRRIKSLTELNYTLL
jgi:hypothetical protein